MGKVNLKDNVIRVWHKSIPWKTCGCSVCFYTSYVCREERCTWWEVQCCTWSKQLFPHFCNWCTYHVNNPMHWVYNNPDNREDKFALNAQKCHKKIMRLAPFGFTTTCCTCCVICDRELFPDDCHCGFEKQQCSIRRTAIYSHYNLCMWWGDNDGMM